jgi:AcrR family transcriptional regulator
MSRKTHLDSEERKTMAAVLAQAAVAPEVADETGAVDGRHARSERSRQAMVDALLDLMREGNLRPSSAQIAERAGVTQRTLFNQFGDMDSLITAVAARQVQRFLELQPNAGEGTVEERVARYCRGLELLLEETMHVRWAVLTSPNPTMTGAGFVRGALDFTRKQLRETFAPELEGLSTDETDEVLDALELETDPIMWRMRRLQQELTSEEARSVVQRTILALLRDAHHR